MRLVWENSENNRHNPLLLTEGQKKCLSFTDSVTPAEKSEFGLKYSS